MSMSSACLFRFLWDALVGASCTNSSMGIISARSRLKCPAGCRHSAPTASATAGYASPLRASSATPLPMLGCESSLLYFKNATHFFISARVWHCRAPSRSRCASANVARCEPSLYCPSSLTLALQPLRFSATVPSSATDLCGGAMKYESRKMWIVADSRKLWIVVDAPGAAF